MTPDEAIKTLLYWQDRLGLRSWEIKVKTRRHVDMSGDSNMGSVWYQKKHERAIVYLLDPVDYNTVELDEFQVDAEQTLVHELLHLVFLISEHGEYEEEVMEKGINRLSRVLVAYRREIVSTAEVLGEQDLAEAVVAG